VTARTLARRVVMRTPVREAFEALRYLECNPGIDDAPAPDRIIAVEPLRGRYRILEDERPAVEVIDTRSMIDHLHARLFALALADRPRSAIIHAALLRRGGKRILVAGSRGAGKTTLALRLMRSGYELEGDEHVFLEADGAIARPRACRVKERSLGQLPDLAEIITASPAYTDVRGGRIFNVDPVKVGGRPWRIEKGPVDSVVVLQPNHGGYSSLRPMPAMMAAQVLMSEIGMRETDRGVSIGAVAALVNRAGCFDLSLGDHDGAVRCLNRALDRQR